MLRLEVDKTESSEGPYKPPKYISLTGNCTVLGRGYQANIRLPFSWLSRVHATITRVDGNCIIEAQGQNGVFVNNKRVQFTRLNDGDTISVGGGRKNATMGATFPAYGGPYLQYSFHKSAKEMKDKENCYRDPMDPKDVMSIQDIVNGQVVNRSYHLEDFNYTDQLSPADNAANVTLVNESLLGTPKVAKTFSPAVPEISEPLGASGANSAGAGSSAQQTFSPRLNLKPGAAVRMADPVSESKSSVTPVKKTVTPRQTPKKTVTPKPTPKKTVTPKATPKKTVTPMNTPINDKEMIKPTETPKKKKVPTATLR